MRKQKKVKKIILGLTGSFGSGKSSVARMFRARDGYIVDADKIAHKLLRPGSAVYKRLVKAFGREIARGNGPIDRKKLAAAAFKDIAGARKLNSITHPEIIRRIREEIRRCAGKVVILDAPLLIEAGLGNLADKVIVVKAGTREQLARLKKRSGLEKQEVLRRLKCQASLRRKIRLADFVIDNSGTLGNTRKQVEAVCEKLNLKRRQVWKS